MRPSADAAQGGRLQVAGDLRRSVRLGQIDLGDDGTGPASGARKLLQPAGFVLRIGGAAIGLNVDAGRERQAFESREVIRRKETRRIVALSPKRVGGASGASQRSGKRDSSQKW